MGLSIGYYIFIWSIFALASFDLFIRRNPFALLTFPVTGANAFAWTVIGIMHHYNIWGMRGGGF